MKYITIFLLLLCLASCKKELEDKKNIKVSSKNLNMNEQSKINCSNAEKQAVKDIAQNKIIYIKNLGMFGYLRSEKEIREILKKYEIDFKIGSPGSCLSHVSDGEYCYAKIMEKEIIKRYGEKFIDSVQICADKKFISNNPNQIFSVKECDEVETYPNPKNGKDFWEKPTKEFNSIFIYPKNYTKCKEEYDNLMDAKFILYKNGKVDSIKVESEFVNSKNNKYKKLFEEKTIEYIKSKKWIPLKRFGIPVNSLIELTFDIK
jgi:hypothetical protein